jgi:hypothetical protein
MKRHTDPIPEAWDRITSRYLGIGLVIYVVIILALLLSLLFHLQKN